MQLIGTLDREGAHALLTRCAPRLQGYLRIRFGKQLGGSQGVDEVVSAAIWRAIERGRSYRPEKGELGFWLWRIGVHLAQDHVRREATRRRHESVAASPLPTISRDGAGMRSAIVSAIDSLSDARHRAILHADLLHGGLAPASVLSKQLGIAEQTVLNLRSAARKRVRPLLEEVIEDGA